MPFAAWSINIFFIEVKRFRTFPSISTGIRLNSRRPRRLCFHALSLSVFALPFCTLTMDDRMSTPQSIWKQVFLNPIKPLSAVDAKQKCQTITQYSSLFPTYKGGKWWSKKSLILLYCRSIPNISYFILIINIFKIYLLSEIHKDQFYFLLLTFSKWPIPTFASKDLYF